MPVSPFLVPCAFVGAEAGVEDILRQHEHQDSHERGPESQIEGQGGAVVLAEELAGRIEGDESERDEEREGELEEAGVDAEGIEGASLEEFVSDSLERGAFLCPEGGRAEDAIEGGADHGGSEHHGNEFGAVGEGPVESDELAAYRFDVFASLLSNAILMLASVFLWKVAYQGMGTVSRVSQDQMISYAIMVVLLRSLFRCDVQDTLVRRLREGEIATDLIKPVNLLCYWLAEDIGTAVSSTARYLIPLLILSTLLFHPPLPATWQAFALFLPSCLLSFGILWLMAALMGMIAFWTLELGNLGMVKDVLVAILSGSIVPLWFFPRSIERVSRLLPFQYTYQTPLGIYVGRTPPGDALGSMAIQLVWVVALALLLSAIWSRARNKVLVQGG